MLLRTKKPGLSAGLVIHIGELSCGTLLQQLQDHLTLLVGLGEHSVRSLMQYLIFGQTDGLTCHVGIPDLGFGCLEVFSSNVQSLDGMFESILVGTEIGSLLINLFQGVINDTNVPVGLGA